MGASDEAQQLPAAASRDFQALQGMTDASVFADEIFGFHAQQAVEKALKAWLALLGVECPRTHDLSLLLNRLRGRRQNVDHLYDVIELNPYAVQYRYGAFEEIGQTLHRKVTVARVADVLRTVKAMTGAGPQA